MSNSLQIVMEHLDDEAKAELIARLTGGINELRKDVAYWQEKYDELHDKQADVKPLNDRIEMLSQDATYWKSVAEQRQATINQTMLVRGKEQCALGIMAKLGGSINKALDLLFADQPDYREAWKCVPFSMYEDVRAIDKGKKIERIKAVRQWLPSLGLKQAKDFVDAHPDYTSA